MKNHEYANLFPMMSDVEVARLAEDIKQNGLSDPIITLDGKILDGRNRHKACEIAEVEPAFLPYAGADPLAFVISHNLHRRHLTESQRGMVAASLANLHKGNPTGANQHFVGNSPDGLIPVTQKQAAEMLSVGVNTVKRAASVKNTGVQELQDMVTSGEVKAATASEVAKLPEAEQRKAVSGGVAGVRSAAKKASSTKLSASSSNANSESNYSEQMSQDQSLNQSQTPSTQGKITETNGMAIFASAKCVMDRLSKTDTQREESLKAMVAYCQNRIDRKK